MTEIINFPEANMQGVAGAEGSVGVAGTLSAPAKKTVNFRGQDVTLKYTLLSLQRLESVGVSMKDLESLGDEDVSITTVGKMLWAGLCVQFNDATLDEVLNSFEISELQSVSEAMAEALSTAGK